MSGLQIKSTGICADRTLPMLNPLFTPAMLSQPLESWDCGVGITADGSGNVSAWEGQIGGRIMIGAGATRPVNTFNMNGHGALRFELSKQLDFTNFWGDAASSPWAYWAVLDVQSLPAGMAQILFDAVGTTSYLSLSSGQMRNGTGSSLDAPAATYMPGKIIMVLYGDASDSTSKLRINGVTVKQSAGLAAATFSLGGPGAIGRYRGTPTQSLQDTALAALGFAKGVQTLLNIQKLEGYLAQRFMPANFLPSGHPYRSVAPRKLT